MKIEKLMTLICYGAELVRPTGVSVVRWRAMIRMAQVRLEEI